MLFRENTTLTTAVRGLGGQTGLFPELLIISLVENQVRGFRRVSLNPSQINSFLWAQFDSDETASGSQMSFNED